MLGDVVRFRRCALRKNQQARRIPGAALTPNCRFPVLGTIQTIPYRVFDPRHLKLHGSGIHNS